MTIYQAGKRYRINRDQPQEAYLFTGQTVQITGQDHPGATVWTVRAITEDDTLADYEWRVDESDLDSLELTPFLPRSTRQRPDPLRSGTSLLVSTA